MQFAQCVEQLGQRAAEFVRAKKYDLLYFYLGYSEF